WTQPTVRIEGGLSIANLDVYPNPSEGTFNISFSSETIQNIDIRIMNVMGEEIVSEKTEQFIGEYTKKILLENQSKGIYFLEIKSNNEIINKKVILQ
ncbi:MAG: T9SS type A sorting domain-containing protein, partial [Flavobacteriales bacterium]|nr:T9SS type A sorting domain-containing protein [Flavobacteriales bacterium]